MSRTITYSCAALIKSGKKGKLKQDEHGYSEICLGAFNVFNSGGIYYPMLDSVKEMFAAGGSLRLRLDKGQCHSELEHPAPVEGKDINHFVQRLLTIKADRVSAHIKSVSLVEGKDEKGKSIVRCMGMVRPAGPYGPSLEDSLANPCESTAFSVRSLCSTKPLNGRLEKHVTNIITWDQVLQPGISMANKFDTPSLEQLQDDSIIPEAVLRGIAEDTALSSQAGMEECSQMATRIITDLGWQKVEIINPEIPGYLNW